MDTNQIYTIVNEVVAEATGQKALATVSADDLVSLGNTVLSSSTNTENFLSTLAQRIGRTIISYRQYRNKFGDMVLNDFEYGAILQKIRFGLTDAVEDPSYDLTDGDSVDPWTIYKPTVTQKLFVKRTPYMYPITVSRDLLKEAFLSGSALDSFIGGLFGWVRNSVEVGLENLGRTALNNMIAENDTKEIKLVTLYNTAAGLTATDQLTAQTAVLNADFLRWAIGYINQISDMFTDMDDGTYNDGSVPTFTPYEDQKIKLLSSFNNALRTQVQYAAFNREDLALRSFDTVNFWQAKQTPGSINVDRASDSTNKTIANIVGVLYDREALGTYQQEEDVLTTPVNAAGRYYTTYNHYKQLWFNDKSENFAFFTLN